MVFNYLSCARLIFQAWKKKKKFVKKFNTPSKSWREKLGSF